MREGSGPASRWPASSLEKCLKIYIRGRDSKEGGIHKQKSTKIYFRDGGGGGVHEEKAEINGVIFK